MIVTRQAVTNLMADEAERLGADPDDGSGIVWHLVTRQGLGIHAWFCICCELADRQARREGYADALDKAVQRFDQRLVQRRLAALA